MQYKKDVIRKTILDCALCEFEEKGYSKASVLRIAKNAKVPIGNLYRYFKSKHSLFEEIVKCTVVELPIVVQKIYNCEIKDNHNLKEVGDNIARHIIDIRKKYGRQLLLLVDKCDGSSFENYYQEVLRYIVDLIEEGLYQSKNSQNRLLSQIITEGYLNGIFSIMREVNESEMEQKIRQLSLFYFYKVEERI